jgi:hypothetical protein
MGKIVRGDTVIQIHSNTKKEKKSHSILLVEKIEMLLSLTTIYGLLVRLQILSNRSKQTEQCGTLLHFWFNPKQSPLLGYIHISELSALFGDAATSPLATISLQLCGLLDWMPNKACRELSTHLYL